MDPWRIGVLALIGLGLFMCSQFLRLPSEFSACPSYTSVSYHLESAKSHLNSSRFYDCDGSPQGWPIFANKVGGVAHEYFLSMQDIGAVSNEFQRMVDGNLFWKADVSSTIQAVLEQLRSSIGVKGVVIDVGANIGWAAFAAVAMGYEVVAFEPVHENVNKLCDGVHFNRASNRVKIVHAAVSDSPGTATLHKVVGRYDNTAVSKTGATANIKSDVIPFEVETVTVDSVVPDDLQVAMMKIDVQGWELHVFKGAMKLISRDADRAPYIMYEEADNLLAASNTKASEIVDLLNQAGYVDCVKVGDDKHCSKRPEDLKWAKAQA